MREIVFDTETTGFDPFSGDRIVEIGCVEIDNLVPTGEHFHCYVNPQREVPDSAFKVHGLSAEFLADHPVFGDIADSFLEFISDAQLIAHNASFDMRFINWELENIGKAVISADRAIDTLTMARTKFPGAKNSLDALCSRFGIDNSHRDLHGALLDSEILAEVYLELKGGRQAGLDLGANPKAEINTAAAGEDVQKSVRPHRVFAPSDDEMQSHSNFLDALPEAIWRK